MNKFKKTILKLFIISIFTVFSTNCFAMKKDETAKNNISQKSNNYENDKKNFNCKKIPLNKINDNNIINLSEEMNYNQDNKYLNKKTKLENDIEKKDETAKNNISQKSNDNKNSKKIFNCVKIPLNKFKKDNKKELNLYEDILDEKRLFKERYKKRIIMYIFMDNMAHITDQIFNDCDYSITSFDIDTGNSIHFYVGASNNFHNLEKTNFKKQLSPSDFLINFTTNFIEEFESDYFGNLINNIVSNYKFIIGKSIENTMNSLKNLTKKEFNKIINDKETKKTFDKIFDQVNFSIKPDDPIISANSIFKELKNINRKDLCFKYFTDIKALVNEIGIQVIKENASGEDDKWFDVKKTKISGEKLASCSQMIRPSNEKWLIFTSKKDSFKKRDNITIKFKEYDFLKNLENF